FFIPVEKPRTKSDPPDTASLTLLIQQPPRDRSARGLVRITARAGGRATGQRLLSPRAGDRPRRRRRGPRPSHHGSRGRAAIASAPWRRPPRGASPRIPARNYPGRAPPAMPPTRQKGFATASRLQPGG